MLELEFKFGNNRISLSQHRVRKEQIDQTNSNMATLNRAELGKMYPATWILMFLLPTDGVESFYVAKS